jgi:hypothetical protein
MAKGTLKRKVENGRLIAPTVTQINQGEVVRDPLPDLRDLKDLEPYQQYAVLSRFKIAEDIETAQQHILQGIIPMQNRSREAAALELDSMLDAATRKALRRQTKKAMREYAILDTLDGNVDQEVVWICENDENSCQNCIDMDGTIGVYSDFVADGTLPGASVCLGGDDCNCQLSVVE